MAQHFRAQPAAAAKAPAPALETPAVASPQVVKAHPYLKYLEITGWRLFQNPKKQAEIKFVVINHSGADLPDVAALVNLRAHAGSDSEPIGTFNFRLPSLAPYESKDVTATLNTKLKVYEFPDWQNLFEEIQLTSPAK